MGNKLHKRLRNEEGACCARLMPRIELMTQQVLRQMRNSIPKKLSDPSKRDEFLSKLGSKCLGVVTLG